MTTENGALSNTEPATPLEDQTRSPKAAIPPDHPLLGPDGKFKKGNKGGPGRTPKGKQAVIFRSPRFRRILREEITDEDLRELARAYIDAAKRGWPDAQQMIAYNLLD